MTPMKRAPLVSVVMPVRNGELYVDDAIRSVCEQTYPHWELVVVDDGSTDRTPNLLSRWVASDPRIRVIRQKPLGLVAASNAGIAATQGEYIARLDSDDVASRHRLRIQVAVMESRRDLVVLGSAIRLFGARRGILLTPMTDWGCRGRLLFENCFAHSSVMMRKSCITSLEPLYQASTEFSEDYGVWVRLTKVGRFANLPLPLVKYRVHARQISREKAERLRQAHAEIVTSMWRSWGVDVSEDRFLRVRWPDFGGATYGEFLRDARYLSGALGPLWRSRHAPHVMVWLLLVVARGSLKAVSARIAEKANR